MVLTEEARNKWEYERQERRFDKLSQIHGKLVFFRKMRGGLQKKEETYNHSLQLANFMKILEEQVVLPINKFIKDEFPYAEERDEVICIEVGDIKHKMKTLNLSVGEVRKMEDQLINQVEVTIERLYSLVFHDGIKLPPWLK
jgi:hypothetical protein